MNTLQINEIIEYLTKNGLTPEDIENDGEYTSLEYDPFWVDISCNDDKVIVVFTTPFDDYSITFDKWSVDRISEFASGWEIHKGFIKITFNTKDKQNLVETLKRCIAMFVEG